MQEIVILEEAHVRDCICLNGYTGFTSTMLVCINDVGYDFGVRRLLT